MSTTRQVQPVSGALRAVNRAHVVRVLRHAGWATRADLVTRTGLSRATVSSVLGELSERGLITERSSSATGGKGRPASQVGLNKAAGTAIAVDVGVHHVAVAVGDLSHNVLAERWVTVSRNHATARGAELVLADIENAVEQAGVEPDELVGAAISVAAPVAAGSKRLAVPSVLPGWNGSALARLIAERWAIPVAMENDANLGALGEAVSRPVPDGGDVLYVKVASRIGLGIVRDRRIVRGRNGFAGELGHVPARSRGELCWCGRQGCLELYAGADGMLRRLAGEAGVDSIDSLIAASRTSAAVRRVVCDGVALLARALAGVVVMLDPARVVLGGELTGLGDLLEEPIRRELDSLPFGTPVELTVSPLEHRASLVGALSLVLTEPNRFADHAQGREPVAHLDHLDHPSPFPQSPFADTPHRGARS